MARQRGLDKERYWRELLRAWRRSGLSVRAFCTREHISIPSFYAWRRTLAVRDQTAPPPSQLFVPVQVLPATPHLEIVLRDDRVLRVPAGFDPSTLRQLLVILDEAPPC